MSPGDFVQGQPTPGECVTAMRVAKASRCPCQTILPNGNRPIGAALPLVPFGLDKDVYCYSLIEQYMFIRLEPSSAVPVYRQIIDQIKYQVAGGTLRAGDRLPSVRELARRLPANQNTVLKAYELLTHEGLLSRRQGDGTFVTDAPSAIKKSERLRKVSTTLAQAAAQAVHFGITAEELHALLDQEIAKLPPGGPSHE